MSFEFGQALGFLIPRKGIKTACHDLKLRKIVKAFKFNKFPIKYNLTV